MRHVVWGLLLCLSALPVSGAVRVVDGDTLEVDDTMVRINGIDAPEVGQECGSPSGQWSCGKEAVRVMAELVEGKDVSCVAHSTGDHGRTIATCYVDGFDVGKQLVESGYAWAFIRYSDVYVQQEAQARAAKLGIWRGEALRPWDYRAQRWNDAVKKSDREAPEGCPIKGNISRYGKIYHAPWSPWYDRTIVNPKKGERWFCDELEAVEAGWRAPYWW